jgi:glycolate oxidase FAD binding subunit
MDDWGVKGPRPGRREQVASESQLAELLRAASRDGLAVIPRGGGTQDTWGGPLRRADIHLDLTGLSGIVDYEPADLTVTVRAGTRLAELQAVLGERGQWRRTARGGSCTAARATW